jgi:hypothetical protein
MLAKAQISKKHVEKMTQAINPGCKLDLQQDVYMTQPALTCGGVLITSSKRSHEKKQAALATREHQRADHDHKSSLTILQMPYSCLQAL